MRDILIDLLKHSTPFSYLKVVGTKELTSVFASSECKTMIFNAVLKQPILEFEGEFAITNLSLLNGLLNMPTYRTETSTFDVKRRTVGDKEIVEQIEFTTGKGAKSAATFRLSSPNLEEVVMMTGSPVWNVDNIMPDPVRVAEFQKLASLYSEVGKTFIPKTDSGDLVFVVGNLNSSTHNASMVFAEGVTGEITGDFQLSFPMFQSVMKIAGGNPTTLSLKSRSGPMRIKIESPCAVYEYFIRATK